MVAPEVVRQMHIDCMHAGADVIITDTYSDVRSYLALAGIEDRFEELSRTAEDNVRLSHEVDTLRTQVATTEGRNAEAQTLRTERDQVRARVAEMLDQLEELSL